MNDIGSLSFSPPLASIQLRANERVCVCMELENEFILSFDDDDSIEESDDLCSTLMICAHLMHSRGGRQENEKRESGTSTKQGSTRERNANNIIQRSI